MILTHFLQCEMIYLFVLKTLISYSQAAYNSRQQNRFQVLDENIWNFGLYHQFDPVLRNLKYVDYHSEYSALCGPTVPPDSLRSCYGLVFCQRQVNPHNALSDAQATASVFEDLARGASQLSYRNNPPTYPSFLHYLDATRRY